MPANPASRAESLLSLGPAYLGVAALLLFSTGCDDLGAAQPYLAGPSISVVPAVALPSPSGSHRVGRRELVWSDVGRERSIPVFVYYPAWVMDTMREPVLQDSIWRAVHRDELSRMVGDGPAAGLSNLTTTARSNAMIEPSASRFPVLLFAPARGWLPTDYSALLEDLASRGFVVLAIAPPGEAATVRLPDGTVIPTADASEASHQRTAMDLRFVIWTLRHSDADPTWPLRGMLDFSRVGVFGHGLGGTAAFLVAARDTSFRAAANLDGDFLGSESQGLPQQPLFYLSTQPAGVDGATIDRWAILNPMERRHSQMWNATRVDSRWSLRAQVIGMAGGNFTDAALMPAAVTQLLQGRLSFGAIEGTRGIGLTAGLLENFFTAVFAGSRANFLAASNNYPEARLSY